MADYWAHWLEMQEQLGDKFPKVYQVNWFRKDENGKFIWPGYGENSRVLDWIVRRAAGEVDAVDGVTGRYPKFEEFNLEGLDLGEAEWAKMYDIDPEAWLPRWTGPKSTSPSSATSSPRPSRTSLPRSASGSPRPRRPDRPEPMRAGSPIRLTA